MDALELAKKLGGTYNANKVRAVVDGQNQVVAMFVNNELTLTDAGRTALNRATAELAEVKTPVKTLKAPKAKAGLEPAPAVELPDVQLSDE